MPWSRKVSKYICSALTTRAVWIGEFALDFTDCACRDLVLSPGLEKETSHKYKNMGWYNRSFKNRISFINHAPRHIRFDSEARGATQKRGIDILIITGYQTMLMPKQTESHLSHRSTKLIFVQAQIKWNISQTNQHAIHQNILGNQSIKSVMAESESTSRKGDFRRSDELCFYIILIFPFVDTPNTAYKYRSE